MGHVRQMNRATEVSARSLHGGELFMNEHTTVDSGIQSVICKKVLKILFLYLK